MTVLGAASCVIPPSLSVEDQDPAQNSPPAILAVRADTQPLKDATKVVFQRGAGTLNVDVIDTDVDDTLFVKVFVDYNAPDPTAPRANCTAAPIDAPRRNVTCDLAALCLSSDTQGEHTMTVMVFDRPVLDAGEPLFQAMPEGGLSTYKFYMLTCSQPARSAEAP